MLRVAEHYAAHRHRPPARAQRGQLLRALAAVRRRRRHGRRAGRRGRLAARRRGVRRRAARRGGHRRGAPGRRSSSEANARIHELSQSDRDRAGMGTTLTAAYVGEREVAIAHVGDSRAYLPARRRARAPDRDHSLVEESCARASSRPRRPTSTRSARSSPARSGPRPTSRSTRARCPAPRRRRVPAVQRRADVDGPRGAGRRRPARRRPALRDAGARADRRRQRGRRARQHHGRPVPPRGRRRRRERRGADDRASRRCTAPALGRATAAARRRGRAARPAEHRAARRAAARAPHAARRRAPAGAPSAAGAARRRRPRRDVVRARRSSLLGGAYLASQAVYFLGVDDDGSVARLPRLPYDLPARAATSTAPTTSRRAPPTQLPRRAQRTSCSTTSCARTTTPATSPASSSSGSWRRDERPQPRAARADPGVAAGDRGLRGDLHPAAQRRSSSNVVADLRRDLPRRCASRRTSCMRFTLPDADPYLFPLVAVLACFGLVMIYRIDDDARARAGAVVRHRPGAVRGDDHRCCATTACSSATAT